MTIQFIEEENEYSLYLNLGNLTGSIFNLKFESQYSNTTILDTDFTIGETNDRYTRIDFIIPSDIPSQHLNSMANYYVTVDDTIIDSGIIKITTIPGGGQWTENYTSNNETRESKVYYRPNW